MKMVFCRGCGKEIHETAPSCPHCGAPQGQKMEINKDLAIPDGIKGWSWGAFLLNWIWAIGNKTWVGLFAIIPYVGLIMAIVLGFKGREWAWKNKEWESIDHFNSVQKKWSFLGVSIVVAVFVIGILAAIAIPAYQDYMARAKEVEYRSQTEEASQEIVSTDNTQNGAFEQISEAAKQIQEGPSFDCANASTSIERQICTSPELSKLDLELSNNYNNMRASDIGSGAQLDLKTTQESWMLARNTCSDMQCIVDAYKKRSNEICENYPVLSGVFPECTYYE